MNASSGQDVYIRVDAHAESQSTFAVDFRLASPFNFVFTSPSLHGDFPRASLVGAGSVFFDITGVEPGSTFIRTGQLSRGDYSLLVEEKSIFGFHSPFSGTGAFRFAFDLTPAASPTPEPASLLLLGTAIAGMFGCRNLRTPVLRTRLGAPSAAEQPDAADLR